MTFREWARWFWRTRNCEHLGERRAIGGDERMQYGFRFRCVDCGKVLK